MATTKSYNYIAYLLEGNTYIYMHWELGTQTDFTDRHNLATTISTPDDNVPSSDSDCLRGFFNLSFGANLVFDPPCRTMEIPGDRISAQAGELANQST